MDQESLRREWNRVREERFGRSKCADREPGCGWNESDPRARVENDSDSVMEGETREWEEARSKRKEGRKRTRTRREGDEKDGKKESDEGNRWGSWFWQGFDTVKLHDYLKRLAEIRKKRAEQHEAEFRSKGKRKQEANNDFDERWNTVAGFWRRKMAQNRDYTPQKKKKERSRTKEKVPESSRNHPKAPSNRHTAYANWYSWRAHTDSEGTQPQHEGEPKTASATPDSRERGNSRGQSFEKSSPEFSRPCTAPNSTGSHHSTKGQHSTQHTKTPGSPYEESKERHVELRVKERVENLRNQQKELALQEATREQLRDAINKKLERFRQPHVTIHVLLRAVGIPVEGGHRPSKKQVDAAMKKAMLRFHPDRCRGSHVTLEKQVESEEIFKLLNQRRQADVRS